MFILFGVIYMGKRRTRLEIVDDILSVINFEKKASRTHVMYKTYLNYHVFCQYLNDLLDSGLIQCSDNNTYYSLTEKGKKFLATFNKYSKFREVVHKQLEQMEEQLSALNEMLV